MTEQSCERCIYHRITMLGHGPAQGFELACRKPEARERPARLADAAAVMDECNARAGRCGQFADIREQYTRIIREGAGG